MLHEPCSGNTDLGILFLESFVPSYSALLKPSEDDLRLSLEDVGESLHGQGALAGQKLRRASKASTRH